MLYSSTRGCPELVCAAHAIVRGMASDGGLFMPCDIRPISITEICAMRDLSYRDRAVMVLSRFLTDFTEDELRECVDKAYAIEKFGDEPAPLRIVKKDADVLELWHGPTSAFKDMALQILPLFLTKAVRKASMDVKMVVLVATSGDTGKAALDGFADVPGTEVIVFYPQEGVSDIQKLQMTTQRGSNVHVFGVKGNFDDAQAGVKKIFGNAELALLLKKNGCAFSSANSINWGRLVPQIVYYFSAYADAIKLARIKAGDTVNFAVPTGNFGDILAGYLAKLMGLPVHKFICASNTNKVLADFINTGSYDKRRQFFKTISPSMDILVSSNLERLLYLETDRNVQKVSKWMEELNSSGVYKVDSDVQNSILKDFFGTWVDEIETKETIADVYQEHGYLLDPHTAVAWRAMQKYRLLTSDRKYCIVLSTASPFKFNSTVLSAINPNEVFDTTDAFGVLHALALETQLEIPRRMLEIEQLPVLHDEVIETGAMESKVKEVLGIEE